MSASPTQRSLAYLREQGWVCDVVERYIVGANIRRDFLGIIDIIALRGTETLAVQTTNYTNVPARIHKIADSPHVTDLRKAGWTIHVHGWQKKNGRWQVRTVDVS